MLKTGTAYFVRHPRTCADLLAPHLLREERRFSVAETVTLSAVDYENFACDMLADRAFLSEHAAVCAQGPLWSCLLIRRRGARDGILVLPERGPFVGYAAHWEDPDAAPGFSDDPQKKVDKEKKL